MAKGIKQENRRHTIKKIIEGEYVILFQLAVISRKAQADLRDFHVDFRWIDAKLMDEVVAGHKGRHEVQPSDLDFGKAALLSDVPFLLRIIDELQVSHKNIGGLHNTLQRHF